MKIMHSQNKNQNMVDALEVKNHPQEITKTIGSLENPSQLARVMLYSHDTMGLGHFRRNLVIAKALSQDEHCGNVLLITGINTINSYPMPAGVDCLTLPAFYKNKTGEYQPRTLNLKLNELIHLRSSSIKSAVQSFKPDVFIVDNVPLGVRGELLESLKYLNDSGTCKCVLGLRDILDSPEAIQQEWESRNNSNAIKQFFDEVWIYGDQTFYNPVIEYEIFNEFSEKIRFTGYFDRKDNYQYQQNEINHTAKEFDLPSGKIVLCIVGGGQDGSVVAETFSQIQLPDGFNAILVTGPFMPEHTRDKIQRHVGQNPRWRVIDFYRDPIQLLIDADAVVSMAGYNTISEILSLNKPSFVVPRTEPRLEQKIRAQRLEGLGLVTMCLPDKLSTSAIETWLGQSNNTITPTTHGNIDFSGLTRITYYLRDLLVNPQDISASSVCLDTEVLLHDTVAV